METPTKVVGRRIVAWLIDVVLGFAVFFALFFANAEQVDSFFDTGFRFENVNGNSILLLDDSAYVLDGSDATTVNLVSLGFWVLNLVVLTGLTGASIGKFVAGIRVVRSNGDRCGLSRAFVRWLLWIVDAFPYFAPLVGFVTALASEGNRRVGDMAAGTYVVRTAHVGEPIGGRLGARPGVAPSATAYGAPSPDAQWDPARQAWIRWDGTAWTQHDPHVPGGWRPIS